MKAKLLVLVVAFGMIAEVVAAQYVTPTPAPPPTLAGPAAKSDKTPVEHGSRPDPGAVRPGNRDGDQPSAAAGDLVRSSRDRRIFGLPVNAALVIGGVLVMLVVLAGVALRSGERAPLLPDGPPPAVRSPIAPAKPALERAKLRV